ncbi:MAG: fibronectin type III domain-containing protein [Candidatus Moraniibacteriota bacterium]|nr:MAG: fibronectin type III domain-containing protein [Candidatus Moranbacteria bacterium]
MLPLKISVKKRMLRSVFFSVTALFLFIGISSSAEAANKYVRQGASGNGSDWTNAYATLPSDLTRGDTYYIADGSYGSYTFDDNASGTTPITIKKCTASDHGTETGYSSAYCDGQAVFGSFIFASDYWIIDGATRNESNWADGGAYGFRVSTFSANTSFSPGVCASNLTMQYVNAGGTPTGNPPTGGVDAAFYIGGFDEYCQNWTMSHNYVHDTITTYHMNGVRGGLIEYSYIVNGWSKEAIRGQICMSNFSIRHNIFKDSCQGNPADPTAGACTGTIALFDGYENSACWANSKIYGNVLWVTNSASMQDAIIVIGGSNDNVPGVEIYNNTLAGFKEGNLAVLVRGSGSVCRNNLSYDTARSVAYSCSSSSNNIHSNISPFVNYSGGDFRLSGATAAGYSLGSPYNADLLSNTRGADGTWDIGAYEYTSGSSTPDTTSPTSPTGLAANATSQSSITVSWTASTDPTVAGQTTSGISNYVVERCQGTGCSTFTQVGTPTTSPFVDSGLTPNTFYNYHVRATDAAGNLSGWSNVVGATTQAPDTQAPTAPSNLQTSVVSSSSINLAWTASTDNVAVTNYTVERCSGTSCTTFTQIATPTTNSYSDAGLTGTTTYRYRVLATDAANNLSPYSNIASATTPVAPPVSQYLQAGYNFAEGTGTTTQDISGHNHAGTLSNTTWSTSGKYGNALDFNGTSSSVGIGNWNIPGSAITLSAWVRADDWKTDDVRILSKATDSTEQGHTWMLSDSNSLLRFRLKTGGTTTTLVATSGTLQTNVWTHVAAVYDGSTMTLYKDGLEVGSQAKTGTIDQNTANISIGANPEGSNSFDGTIDDVRIYNKALTQSEIQTDMNTALTSGGGGTVACNTVTTANFSDAAYNSYGAPFDPFTSNTPLVNVTCNSADTDTITLTTGITGDTTRIVYTKGYWYDAIGSAWRQYTGTCTGALNGEWCQGSVSATITDANVSTSGTGSPTYLVGMTCSVQGGGWKCGCRDTSCTNFSWQIQGAGQ